MGPRGSPIEDRGSMRIMRVWHLHLIRMRATPVSIRSWRVQKPECAGAEGDVETVIAACGWTRQRPRRESVRL